MHINFITFIATFPILKGRHINFATFFFSFSFFFCCKVYVTALQYKLLLSNLNLPLDLEISELQTNLIVNDRTNKHTSYISEPWFDMYLSARVPVPINYNPFMMLTPDPRPEFNDQLVRATYMAISCARFKKALDAQVLSPEIFHVKPKYSDTAFFQNFVK